MTFAEWIAYGIAHDYCAPPSCDTHDLTLTDEELESDHCVYVLRLRQAPDDR